MRSVCCDTASTRLTPRWLTIWSKAAIRSLSASWTLPAPFAAAAAASLASDARRSLICADLRVQRGHGLSRLTPRSAPGRGRPRRRSRRQGGASNSSNRVSSASFWLLTAPRNWLSRASNCSPHRAAAESRIAAASSARSRIRALSRSLDPVSPSSRTWPRTTTVSCKRSAASLRRVTRLSPCTTMVSESRSPPLWSRSTSEFDRSLKSRATASLGDAELIGDGLALGADRGDGLRAARADPADDVVRIRVDGAARRRGSLGEPIGDRVAMEADRLDGLFAACADASHDSSMLGCASPPTSSVGDSRHGSGSPRPVRRCADAGRLVCIRDALRAAAEPASRSAMESPWKRIPSTACSPLALTRATTSSAYSAAALRAASEAWESRSATDSPWKRIAVDGLFAACADARDDVVRVFADGAARRRRGLRRVGSATEFALGADRFRRFPRRSRSRG